jgi:hypothetical protein
VSSTSRKQWMVTFERAALEYVAGRKDLILDETCPLVLEPCLKHGGGCLQLIVGVLLGHISWQTVDPETAAVTWLRTLLPKPAPTDPVLEYPPPMALQRRDKPSEPRTKRGEERFQSKRCLP